MRLPEPGGRQLLLALRRAAREGDARHSEATADLLAPRRSASSPTSSVEGLEGPALVVRSGGGRAGETFKPAGERTRIGRSPECEIFLDDVTVSRNHAVLVERDGGLLRRGSGLAQRHVRQPPPDRQHPARGRRRAPDRQVPDDLRRAMSAVTGNPASASVRSGSARSCGACARSSPTSRSPRSASSRTRAC